MYRTSTPDYILENRNNFRALVEEGIALACYKNPGWQTWHLIKKACLGCEYENGSQDEHICMMDQEGFVIDVIRQLARHVIPYDLYKRQVVLAQMAYIVGRDREKFEQLKLVDFLNMWSGQENTFYYDPFLAVDGDSVEKHYRTLMGEESAPDSSASGELYEPAAKKSG